MRRQLLLLVAFLFGVAVTGGIMWKWPRAADSIGEYTRRGVEPGQLSQGHPPDSGGTAAILASGSEHGPRAHEREDELARNHPGGVPSEESTSWTWEQVEDRLPTIFQTSEDSIAGLTESLLEWPEITPENSRELHGVRMSQAEIEELGARLYGVNGEIRSNAEQYARELAQVRWSVFETSSYEKRAVPPGEDPPKAGARQSCANFAGWQVTWPAITVEEYPHLQVVRNVIRDLKTKRHDEMTRYFYELQDRRKSK